MNAIPQTEYNRLLVALGLPRNEENQRTFLVEVCQLLEVRMSQVSDCIRRGHVTDPVLAAGKAKGINPEFIKNGMQPIRLKTHPATGHRTK